MNDNAPVDSPEMIRKEMEETKLQLVEKLETLEKQVVETVQTTENAVQATVGAVQETVENVKGGIQDAAKTVSQAFDLTQHIQKHPWLVVGGAVVAGYLAAEFLTDSGSPSASGSRPATPDSGQGPAFPTAMNGSPLNLDAAASYRPGAYTPVSKPTFLDHLSEAAIGSFIAIVPQITSRLVPRIVDRLMRDWEQPSPPRDNDSNPSDQVLPPSQRQPS